MEIDIEDLNRKYDATINRTFARPTKDCLVKYRPLIEQLLASANNVLTENQFKQFKSKHKFNGKNSFLYQVFQQLPDLHVDGNNDKLRNMLKIKKGKSHSGVLVITVLTSPYPEYTDKNTGQRVIQTFSCSARCSFCPNEPGQPRSYLKGEPGVMRANKNGFDPVRQMHDRMSALYTIGHPVDKLEVIVLGGTWTSYPLEYREQFCRDLYYAANIFDSMGNESRREPLSLNDEKKINRTATCKIIGLTLETRPDTITPQEVRDLRYYGCTRVQLGVQHLDNYVLDKINRKCSTETYVKALRVLKDAGFKVDGHFMPNLPFSTVEKDHDMLIDKLLGTRMPVPRREHNKGRVDLWETWNVAYPEYQMDQWKVYPCAIVPWTEIEQWYKNGEYVPYAEEHLVNLLLEMKALMFPWIRLNRIIRDIPGDYIIASSDKSNLRQELTDTLAKEGKKCRCIRCREIKNEKWGGSFMIVVREYKGSDGSELFISAESQDMEKLYGFLRLRFPSSRTNTIFPELHGCALIRELHVYGRLQLVVNGEDAPNHVQHRGIGRQLLSIAEEIVRARGIYSKCAVIAGEGTKEYYKSNGYVDAPGKGGYMYKGF